ncbi:hypothetical protein V1478_015965, partial [Vespula squamosa]
KRPDGPDISLRRTFGLNLRLVLLLLVAAVMRRSDLEKDCLTNFYMNHGSPRGKCNYSSAASLRPLIFASDGTIIILAFDARKIRDGNWKSALLGSLVSRMFSGYPYEG